MTAYILKFLVEYPGCFPRNLTKSVSSSNFNPVFVFAPPLPPFIINLIFNIFISLDRQVKEIFI